MMRLRHYIALVYALLICIALSVLSLTVNIFSEKLFSNHVKENIKNECNEIIRSLTEQYDKTSERLNMAGVSIIGMHYLHRGYLISIEDMAGNSLWNVYEADTEQCDTVINEISHRMASTYRIAGSFQRNQLVLTSAGTPAARVNIETYNPYFYSETEAAFLRTLNAYFAAAGIVFVLASLAVSVLLAAAIARPVMRAKEAARKIAGGDFSIRIPEKYFARELHELALAINDLAQELANGEQWQKRLTADIAHELRTPLAALQGTIDAMLDGFMEPSSECLKSCGEEIERLHKLIEDLNMLSVLERDKVILHKSSFDLAELLASTIGQFMPLIREKGLEVKTRMTAAVVYADYDRLKQVFINVLSNAIQYTGSGGITVTVKKGINSSRVSIADTGAGISETDLPHVFERFYRSDKSRSRVTGGAGIGLAISAAIITAHGGKISVENNNRDAGKTGSIFHIEL
jgi:signal transduction histidine kinase